MRIDEFSSAADIDGTFSREEITRFLTVGFDTTIHDPNAADSFVVRSKNFNFTVIEKIYNFTADS